MVYCLIRSGEHYFSLFCYLFRCLQLFFIFTVFLLFCFWSCFFWNWTSRSSFRYIPTGVLFDLLCAEPERPWNLTVQIHYNFLCCMIFYWLCISKLFFFWILTLMYLSYMNNKLSGNDYLSRDMLQYFCTCCTDKSSNTHIFGPCICIIFGKCILGSGKWSKTET